MKALVVVVVVAGMVGRHAPPVTMPIKLIRALSSYWTITRATNSTPLFLLPEYVTEMLECKVQVHGTGRESYIIHTELPSQKRLCALDIPVMCCSTRYIITTTRQGSKGGRMNNSIKMDGGGAEGEGAFTRETQHNV